MQAPSSCTEKASGSAANLALLAADAKRYLKRWRMAKWSSEPLTSLPATSSTGSNPLSATTGSATKRLAIRESSVMQSSGETKGRQKSYANDWKGPERVGVVNILSDWRASRRQRDVADVGNT